jgi:thiamine biosynthesis lipoprotein
MLACLRTTLLGSLPSLLLVFLMTACGPAGPRTYEFHGLAMGTTWSVKVVAASMDRERQQALEALVVAELDGVNEKMSHYLETSELSRFNASAEGVPFPASADLLEVLERALEIGEQTDGALDVTIGPLVDAWGFGPPGQPPEPPSDAEILRLLAATGPEHLELDRDAATLQKAVPGLRVDLSAIAKGYAVDRVAEALAAEGLDRFLVEIGGELRALGTGETGEPWRLAVERPRIEGRSVHLVVPLTSGSLATSGDYRNYYEVDGQRITHILDPRTGRPITHRLASVSVVDPLCVRADALATALMVLGPDEGYRLAEQLDMAALFLVRNEDQTFQELITQRFQGILDGPVSRPGDGELAPELER